jgi:hypothetical protein
MTVGISNDNNTNKQINLSTMINEQQKDEQLWQIAKARAAFKCAFTRYFVLSGFLVGVWFFSSEPDSYFWPVWPIMGMGIALAFQYYHAYNGNQTTSTQKEFEKLKNQQ